MLPAPCVRQMDHAKRMAIVVKADRLDASEVFESVLGMQTPVGDIEPVEWRPVQLSRKV